MERRTYLKTGATAAAGLTVAGCLGDGSDGEEGSPTDTESPEDGDEESETITIGSDIPYKPFEWKNNEGEVVGFDVDIADAVFGEQLSYDYEFQETAFDGIIQALNNGNFRVIMSAMTITEERAEKVAFSDPYFTAYQTVVVRTGGEIESKEDLQGRQVGVQKGTTGEAAAEELQEEFDGDLEIERYDQIPDAFSALMNNQVVAVVNDNTVSAEFVSDNEGDVEFLEGEGAAEEEGKENAPDYLTLTVEEYGIAFRQDDDELREQANDALETIREESTYEEIYGEYFEE